MRAEADNSVRGTNVKTEGTLMKDQKCHTFIIHHAYVGSLVMTTIFDYVDLMGDDFTFVFDVMDN